MLEIENLGVSVEEYLDGLAAGIDVLELKRLEPTFRRLTWISNIFYDTMANQANLRSLIIKKSN